MPFSAARVDQLISLCAQDTCAKLNCINQEYEGMWSLIEYVVLQQRTKVHLDVSHSAPSPQVSPLARSPRDRSVPDASEGLQSVTPKRIPLARFSDVHRVDCPSGGKCMSSQSKPVPERCTPYLPAPFSLNEANGRPVVDGLQVFESEDEASPETGQDGLAGPAASPIAGAPRVSLAAPSISTASQSMASTPHVPPSPARASPWALGNHAAPTHSRFRPVREADLEGPEGGAQGIHDEPANAPFGASSSLAGDSGAVPDCSMQRIGETLNEMRCCSDRMASLMRENKAVVHSSLAFASPATPHVLPPAPRLHAVTIAGGGGGGGTGKSAHPPATAPAQNSGRARDLTVFSDLIPTGGAGGRSTIKVIQPGTLRRGAPPLHQPDLQVQLAARRVAEPSVKVRAVNLVAAAVGRKEQAVQPAAPATGAFAPSHGLVGGHKGAFAPPKQHAVAGSFVSSQHNKENAGNGAVGGGGVGGRPGGVAYGSGFRSVFI